LTYAFWVSSNQQSAIVDLQSEIVSRFRGSKVQRLKGSEVQKLKGHPFAGRVMVSGTTSGVLYRTMGGGLDGLKVQELPFSEREGWCLGVPRLTVPVGQARLNDTVGQAFLRY